MITVISVGREHDRHVRDTIVRYETRLRPPFDVRWLYIPYSRFEGERARDAESEQIMAKLPTGSRVILLDEVGRSVSSPEFAKLLDTHIAHAPVTVVIGGAYGVNDQLRRRADVVLSLSRLVFPHMLVRLLLVEQIYRAQEITRGGSYHHT